MSVHANAPVDNNDNEKKNKKSKKQDQETKMSAKKAKKLVRKRQLTADGAEETGKKPRLSDEEKAKLGSMRRRHHYHPGTVALREIRRYQRSDKQLVPRACIERVVRETLAEYKEDGKLSAGALEAVHQASEAFLVDLMRETVDLAALGDMKSIQQKHMQKAARILMRLPPTYERATVFMQRYTARTDPQQSSCEDATVDS